MKLFSALLLGSTLMLLACAKTTEPTDALAEPEFTIAQTESKSAGMVAAANPLATQAGVDILKAGGSAVDAAGHARTC